MPTKTDELNSLLERAAERNPGTEELLAIYDKLGAVFSNDGDQILVTDNTTALAR